MRAGHALPLRSENSPRGGSRTQPTGPPLQRLCPIAPPSAEPTHATTYARIARPHRLRPGPRLHGIGFVAYSPLGRGFLTGQIKRDDDLAEDDHRRHSPRFQGENFAKNLDLVARIAEIAREKGCAASQLALAWVLAQGDDVVPIPGTKRRTYLDENIAAQDVTLDAADLARIAAVAPPGVAAGLRYPAAMMGAIAR